MCVIRQKDADKSNKMRLTKKAEEQGSTQQSLSISGDKDFRKNLVLKNRKPGRCAMLSL